MINCDLGKMTEFVPENSDGILKLTIFVHVFTHATLKHDPEQK